MKFKLGLTGSIGMGKSTTAQMFADEGCAVWDADAAVHRLYQKGGAAVPAFAKAFPDAVIDGAVSRSALKEVISASPDALQDIEAIVHPLVRLDREQFMLTADADIGVFDIPLLFEKNGEAEFDAVACVFVDAETQRQRVLARGTMTEDQLTLIMGKQMPSEEKKQRADYTIETVDLETARRQVQEIVADITGKLSHA